MPYIRPDWGQSQRQEVKGDFPVRSRGQGGFPEVVKGSKPADSSQEEPFGHDNLSLSVCLVRCLSDVC